MYRKTSGPAGRVTEQSLPETPWPVAARGLMSEREKILYQDLISLYPDHKIFVQVALSQLIDVARDHPKRMAIRARFKQLVADFVLCRPDLTIVAVIELDDRSHLRPDRKRADARKSKALADAGLRLVRIPAGAIPALGKLRALIEERGAPTFATAGEETELRLVETVPTIDSDDVDNTRMPFRKGMSRKMKRALRRVGATVIFALMGWFAYTTFLPYVVRRAFEPLAAIATIPHGRPVESIKPVVPRSTVVVPSIESTRTNNSAAGRTDHLTIAELRKQKNRAWADFYSAPSSCEHPAAWNDQVECGNQYMRAKKRFEEQWAAAHPLDQASEPLILDNATIKNSRPGIQSQRATP
jgi:very-short-patch-repair endonuclease